MIYFTIVGMLISGCYGYYHIQHKSTKDMAEEMIAWIFVGGLIGYCTGLINWYK
jgi:hypothetical protein